MARSFRNKSSLGGVAPTISKNQYIKTGIRRLGKKIQVHNKKLTRSPTKYHTTKLLKKREGFSSVSRNIYTGPNKSQGISRNMSSVNRQKVSMPTSVSKKPKSTSQGGTSLVAKALSRAAKAIKNTLQHKKEHEQKRQDIKNKKIESSKKEDEKGRTIAKQYKSKKINEEDGVWGQGGASGAFMPSGPKGGIEHVPGPEPKSPNYKPKKKFKAAKPNEVQTEAMTPGRKKLASILSPTLTAMSKTAEKLKQNAKDYEDVVKKYPAKSVTEDNQSSAQVLKNPSYMHNDLNSALVAAKQMNTGQTDRTSRAYVLHDKYYYERKTKPYIVVDNKQLISQEPNWDQKGYTVKAWVSPVDGVVTRTQDGKYVKGTQQ